MFFYYSLDREDDLRIKDPERNFHIYGGIEKTSEIMNEINNPQKVKDGFVHKHYLKEETKDIIEFFISMES
ncbi:hypothetical protein [Gracilibacillus suaedae]|uniref:hypothetical protein n=1 Tax=Gracilibacillus suaedae TaxID=2820273 RepID=UPI001ABE17A0|nr:hypothetical protein [Gracilibacillus suaedae]